MKVGQSKGLSKQSRARLSDKGSQGKSPTEAVKREIALLFRTYGDKPRRIQQALIKRFADSPKDLETIPKDPRTYRKHKKWTPEDTPWDRTVVDGADAGLVLAVWVTLLRDYGARVEKLSEREARWILFVRKVAPNLDAWNVWRLAFAYAQREKQEQPDFGDLDFQLSQAEVFLVHRNRPSKKQREEAARALETYLKTWPDITPLAFMGVDIRPGFASGFRGSVRRGESPRIIVHPPAPKEPEPDPKVIEAGYRQWMEEDLKWYAEQDPDAQGKQ